MSQENPQAILVIKGNKKDMQYLRRQVMKTDLGKSTSNMVWYEDEISHWTPDVPDGFQQFDRLLTLALRGPKMQRLLAAARVRANSKR